jgi:hypothetical protein
MFLLQIYCPALFKLLKGTTNWKVAGSIPDGVSGNFH